jgi:hypothetical protein
MLRARVGFLAAAIALAIPAAAWGQLPDAPELPVPELPAPDLPAPTPPPAPELPELPLPSPPTPGGGGPGGVVPDVLPGGSPGGGSPGDGPSGGGSSDGGSSGGGSSGGGSSGGGSSGGGSSGGGASGSDASSAVPSVAASSAPGSSRGSSGPAGSSRSGTAFDAPVQRPGRAERRRADARLRRAVRRLSGCLDALQRAERRVLVLRAGLGAGPARSRRGAARMLNVRTERVRRLERRGMRQIRKLARDGCGGGAATDPSGGRLVAASAGDGGGAGADGAAPSAARDSAGAAPRNGGGGQSGAAPNGRGGVRGESDARVPPLASGGKPGTDLTLAILLVLLAAAAGFAMPHLRSTLRR